MKIFVLFVEPMLYGMDLIHEVYEKTEYVFHYLYCTNRLTGRDDITLPENAYVCQGTDNEHKKQVIAELNRFQPDFVIINGYVGNEQATAIHYCLKNHIPYAIESDTPLHIPENKVKALLKKYYLRSLLHNKYCYGFPGGTLQKDNLMYYGIPESKNYIMPMSVSSERLLQVAVGLPDKFVLKEAFELQHKRIFLFVGRLAKEKNVSLLIEAYENIKKNNSIALLIVGDGPERKSLEAMVKERSIKDVHFVGYSVFPEIVQYYKMADVFVLPSVHEPWGLVVNEAMTLGLPVIVSEKVGCRIDLVQHGVNGFIFKSGDSNQLSKMMLDCVSIDDKVMGEKSIQKIEEWNFVLYFEQFLKATGDICSRYK